MERRRDVAEGKLLSGVISDADYRRIREKIDTELAQLATRLADLERDRGTEIEVLREVLALARNLGDAYQKAPPQLKRHFLGLFFERFLVHDRKIAEAVPTRLIKDLAACSQLKLSGRSQVMVRGSWLPTPVQNHRRVLREMRQMGQYKKEVYWSHFPLRLTLDNLFGVVWDYVAVYPGFLKP